jgi:hypothetical protein
MGWSSIDTGRKGESVKKRSIYSVDEREHYWIKPKPLYGVKPWIWNFAGLGDEKVQNGGEPVRKGRFIIGYPRWRALLQTSVASNV